MECRIIVLSIISIDLVFGYTISGLHQDLDHRLKSRSEFPRYEDTDPPVLAKLRGLRSLHHVELHGSKDLPGETTDDEGALRVNRTMRSEAAEIPSDKNIFNWIWGPFDSTTSTTTPFDKPSCPKCQCGVTNKPNRIVGGTTTGVLQYPWVSYLVYRGKFFCGASIISDRYLLTAAHCIDGVNKNHLKIQIGVHNRRNVSETEAILYDVAELIKHVGYSTSNYNNDIALIKINRRIKFDGLIRPVCLPERGPTYAGTNGIVTGWGAIEESGVTSNTLQEVVVPIITNAECRATKYPARKITENMLCAGYTDGKKDACQGDSGGPLHVLDNSVHKVVGVVSWGEGCAASGYPGVYARVNRYITWIEYNTKNSCYCASTT